MMDVEALYQAIRALPISERLRLVERVARQRADECSGAASSVPPGRGRGMDVGRAAVGDDFDAPLPEDLLRAFEGRDDTDGR